MVRSKAISVRADLFNNILLLAILFVGSITQLAHGYEVYLWILLLILGILKGVFILTNTSLLIISFSTIYTVFRYLFSKEPSLATAVFHFLYPISLYEVGKYIARKSANFTTLIVILICIAFCFGVWSIVNNVLDYVETGNIVNIARIVDEESGNEVIPATQHNSMLSMAIGGIGLLLVSTKTNKELRFKIIIVFLSVIALLTTLHLLNRTGIVMAIISLLIGFCWGGLNGMKMLKAFAVLLIVIVLLGIFLQDSTLITSVIDGFTNRDLNEYNGGAATGGGRFTRWVASPEHILTNPLGSSGLPLAGQKVMAHNVWLDIGIDGGIIPFVLFLILTFKFIKSVKFFLKESYIPSFYKAYFFLYITAIILQFSVEPLLQAFFPLYFIFFFIWGLIDTKQSAFYRY